eukprot:scaffold666348_cov59-Prasinocladus_malaysianus.AAC.1
MPLAVGLMTRLVEALAMLASHPFAAPRARPAAVVLAMVPKTLRNQPLTCRRPATATAAASGSLHYTMAECIYSAQPLACQFEDRTCRT